LLLFKTRFFTAKVSERHPIKTGADNYRIPTPLQGKKIAVITNQSGVVLQSTTENLADNKIQTHLVDFFSPKKSVSSKYFRTWFRGTPLTLKHIVDGMDSNRITYYFALW
jgi:hypothetical protein